MDVVYKTYMKNDKVWPFWKGKMDGRCYLKVKFLNDTDMSLKMMLKKFKNWIGRRRKLQDD